jgi:hypothetical protein
LVVFVFRFFTSNVAQIWHKLSVKLFAFILLLRNHTFGRR